MSEYAIKVSNLGKQYRIGIDDQKSETFLGQIVDGLKTPIRNFKRLRSLGRLGEDDEKDIFWALRNVSFNVPKGEVLGIIGHNGAGKSTLLKILSRITEPSTGEITIRGRVSSLLEVGTGFHPELTGRENVFMNGTILGMTSKEISGKFEQILDFSGIEKYIDTPVKRYSSGMKVRLGFSVAAHLEPEILIIDEVLAVGDLGFQRKCLGMMNDVASSGRTVLFVSHNMAAIDSLCTAGLLLHHGSVKYLGDIKSTVKAYISEFSSAGTGLMDIAGTERKGNGLLRLLKVTICDENQVPLQAVQSGGTCLLVFEYTATGSLDDIDIGFSVHDPDNDSLCFILYSSYVGKTFHIEKLNGRIACCLRDIPLPEGRYLIKAQVMQRGEVVDYPTKGVGYIDIIDGDFYGTGAKANRFTRQKPSFLMKGEWS